MAFFGGAARKKEPDLQPPVDIKWVRNAQGRFHNLMMLNTDSAGLQGASGVFAIWKGGSSPDWLYAGSTHNLGQALDQFIDDPVMDAHNDQGGTFVSWAKIKSEYQGGIVRYLNTVMKPQVENPAFSGLERKKEPMIAVFLPGLEK